MSGLTLILVVATVVTGILYAYDFMFKRKTRLANYKAAIAAAPNLSSKEVKKLKEPSGFLGQLGSLFPIILFVFVFRSFIIEPFKIPSGSMMPTLLDGDYIAVTKWNYGIKNPLTGNYIIETEAPKRGDVIVFKYPEDPSVDFIKRIVGLPGDEVYYYNKTIYIKKACNGNDCGSFEPVAKELVGEYALEDAFGLNSKSFEYKEQLGEVAHNILINPNIAEPYAYYYKQEGLGVATWKVPKDHYFVMGDNRDNSRDSRFWGFVSKDAIVGKTIGIWMSLGDRSKDDSLPAWLPTFRFERIGGID